MEVTGDATSRVAALDFSAHPASWGTLVLNGLGAALHVTSLAFPDPAAWCADTRDRRPAGGGLARPKLTGMTSTVIGLAGLLVATVALVAALGFTGRRPG